MQVHDARLGDGPGDRDRPPGKMRVGERLGAVHETRRTARRRAPRAPRSRARFRSAFSRREHHRLSLSSTIRPEPRPRFSSSVPPIRSARRPIRKSRIKGPADGCRWRAQCPGHSSSRSSRSSVCSPAPRTPHRNTPHTSSSSRSGVSLAEGRAAVRAAHGQVADTLPIIHGLAVRLPAGARARLAHDARIAAISANAPIRSQSDRFDPTQLATAYPASVLAPPVWNSPTGATGAGVGVAVIDTGIDGGLPDFSDATGTLARGRLGGHEPGRDDAQRRLRPRHPRRGHHRRRQHPPPGRRSARGPLRRHRPGREPDRDQGVRRRRRRHDPRRDLRPPVRRRPQGRLQHPRRQPLGVLDGRRVLPDRPARRRRRVRLLPRHRRRHRRRQPRRRRRRGELLAGQRSVRDRRRRGRRPGHHGARRRHLRHVVERRHHPGRRRQAGHRRSGRAHRLDPRAAAARSASSARNASSTAATCRSAGPRWPRPSSPASRR